MLRFMGPQRVGHDWVTELNWTELMARNIAAFKHNPQLLDFMIFFFSWQMEHILDSLREIAVYLRIVYSSRIFWRTPWVGFCPMRSPISAAWPGLPLPLLDIECLDLCHSALSTHCYTDKILHTCLSSKIVWLEEAISHAYLSTKWMGKMRLPSALGTQSSWNRVPQI